MDTLSKEVAKYVSQTRHLNSLLTTTEETFYPAIRDLLAAILKECRLPFEVRTGTSEAKTQGTDRPDFVLADPALFVGVFGEVKQPDAAIDDIAYSTERDDQIGRYLARTGVVLVTNIRGFGLVVCAPGYNRSTNIPVPSNQREVLGTVDVWGGASGSGTRTRIDPETVADVTALIERSVTDFAPLADPADLAKVLARQAREHERDSLRTCGR